MEYVTNWDRDNLVINTLGIPPEAINIHGYVKDVPIKEFKNKDGIIINNTARTVDVNDNAIAEWTKLHEDERGLYDDTIHCPPTFKVDLGKLTLCTGTCKTKGADGAGKKSIGAVHISFNDFDGISAGEWEEIARSNENRPLKDRKDFIKNDRQDIDVVGTLKNLYNKGNIKLSKLVDGEEVPFDTDVNKRLAALHIPEKKYALWRNRLYVELGINTERIVSTIASNPKEVESFKVKVTKLYKGKKILFKTMETGTNIKYSIELERSVLDAELEGKPYDIVIFKINDAHTPETLNKTRDKLRNFFTDEKQHFQLDMKRFKSKIIINYPEVLFEPQKEHELIEWKRKGDKLI